MKSVNLIPVGERTTTRNIGKSGGAVYALLGVLGIALIAIAALTISSRQVTEREAQAASLEAQAQAAQSQAGAMASYKQFAALATSRTKTIRDLAATRADWGRTLDQVSQVVPADVALSKLGVTATSATQGAGIALRTALTNPAVELLGCAPSQARVALLMARLRRIDGVVRVSVSTSDKSTAKATASNGATADSGSTGNADCTGGSDQRPQFQIVAFLSPLPGLATTGAATPTTATQDAIGAAKDTTLGTTTPTTATTPPAATTTPTTTPAPAASGS
jgi:Tfp pilus assembly protein PilN